MPLRRSRSRKCRRYRPRLASAADRQNVADLGLRRHLRTCRSCRDEFTQHRTIGRALRELSSSNVSLTYPRTPPSRRFRFPSSSKSADVGVLGAAVVVLLLGAAGVNARRRT